MTTLDFLRLTSSICPDRAAILFQGRRLSFAQLQERSYCLADSLHRVLGIKRGDRVAMMEVNCPQYLEAYFATAILGGIFVPLNYRAKEEELAYLLSHSESSVVVVGERYQPLVKAAKGQAPQLKHVITLGDGALAEGARWTTAAPGAWVLGRGGLLSYEELVARGKPVEPGESLDEGGVTLLLYTAGTTGRPKGVPLTHRGFSSYVEGNVDPPDLERTEVILLAVPLYHVAGFQVLLASVYGGRTTVMIPQFEAAEWLETVQRERVNRAFLVPTMLKRIIEHPDFARYDLSSLRVITYGAASMPFEVITRAIQLLPGIRFINAFGQTETASTVTMLGPEDHIIEGTEPEKRKKLQRLMSSIGRPLPDVEMTVVDEAGNELPPNQIGIIAVRGSRVMAGYWKDPEKTAKQMTRTGWLLTGDVGWRDEEGYFYLSGRGDDMIIRGGENISPEEVEQVVQSHPKVEEAAVIGITDPEWGQQPRAVVVLKEGQQATAEELVEFCRQRLASFKCPRSVVFVSSLPRNPLGKVVRKALREQFGQPGGDWGGPAERG